MRTKVAGILLAVALAAAGCGESSRGAGSGSNNDEHPLIDRHEEKQREQFNREIVCSLSEQEAEARGPEDFETWLAVCR